MKAMVLDKTANVDTSPLQYKDVPDPEPGPREVRVKVRCCGVCRTDLHVIEGDLPEARRPIIPGHMVVGEVDRLGADCHRLETGQRVGVAWLRHTCGECRFCRRGQENLCEHSRYTGYHADGGYAEYCVVPEDFAYEIPEGFVDVDAAPLLCSGLIGYRALKRCNVPEGGSLALYGFGSSAHIVFQIAKHRGYTLYVVSRGEEHLQLARELGAAWAGHNANDMPEPADSAINFAPVGHLVPTALDNLQKGGVLAIAGIYLTDIPALNYEKHIFYERDIHTVTANTREDGREMLREAVEAGVQPEVTTYPLEEANAALLDLKEGRINGSAVLMVKE